MTVYGDILFILNMTVDYLLLLLCEVFLKIKTNLTRRLLAATAGGVFAFYIFFGIKSIIADLLYRIVTSFLIVLIAFGVKKFLRSTAVLVTLSLLQSGCVGFVAELFRLSSVTVSGTVVYAEISPLLLIILSVAFYLIFSLVFRITKNRLPRRFCRVRLCFRGSCREFTALLDSGSSISDPFSDSEVLIIDKSSAEDFFNCKKEEILNATNQKRFRLLPYKTINGSGVLWGVRIDGAELVTEKASIKLAKPLLALSEEQSFGDYEIIVSEGIREGR